MASVIVFGATGAVGSATAIEANERGCKVWLATRDTNKPIKGINTPPDGEQNGSTFSRVQADLTDPVSVTKAIETSGAKAAFIYAIPRAKHHMRSSIQALKNAGVTWVVLLSSYLIRKPCREVKPEDTITYRHAAVEVVLEDVGIPFAAARGGYFASNEFLKIPRYRAGEVNLPFPEVPHDYIDPRNIGQVAGALLSEPRSDIKPSEPVIVYVLGPALVSEAEAARMVGRAMGKDVKVNTVALENWVQEYSVHIPEPVVRWLGGVLQAAHQDPQAEKDFHSRHAGNVFKYSGKQSTKFVDWVEANKQALSN